mgnify:CR=1 FL=1
MADSFWGNFKARVIFIFSLPRRKNVDMNKKITSLLILNSSKLESLLYFRINGRFVVKKRFSGLVNEYNIL